MSIERTTDPTGDSPTVCPCGKVGFPTRAAADSAVVHAKIRRYLHNREQRREQRTYRCPSSGMWHLTSGTSPMPTYGDGDDVAAAEFIRRQLDCPVDEAWAVLLDPDHVRQTRRVLHHLHQDATTARAGTAGMDPVLRGRQLRREAGILARLDEARAGEKALNVAEANSEARRQNELHRDVVRQLALAVAAHRDQTATPTAVDRQLWAWLGVLAVPHGRGTRATLQGLLDDGTWHSGEVTR